MNGRKTLIDIDLTFVFFSLFCIYCTSRSCLGCWYCCWIVVIVLCLSYYSCCSLSFFFIIVLVLQMSRPPISSPPNAPPLPLLPPSSHPLLLLPPLSLLHSLACFKVGGGNEVFNRQLILLWSNRVSLPALLSGVSAVSLSLVLWYIHYPQWQVEFLLYWHLLPLPLVLPRLAFW